MKAKDVNPCGELYSQLQRAAKVFNAELFDGELPNFIFTLQRGKNSAGYFSPDQWSGTHGELASEIAINPSYLANHSLLVLFQTIVHELCHLWQHQYGRSKPRMGYHNQEWAEKMEQIGLMPSSTGEAGGRRVGQKMADYPSVNGRFMNVSRMLAGSGFGLDWVDRDFNINQVSCRSIPTAMLDNLNAPLLHSFPELAPLVKSSREQKKKIKYCCPKCTTKVWGKPELFVMCASCNCMLESKVA
jgi:predicted SprT family Zn-dependent metalloprotease